MELFEGGVCAGRFLQGGSLFRGGDSEANVSAEHTAPGTTARVPSPHVDARRQNDRQGAAPSGQESTVSLIWRIRHRRVFGALRAQGRRASCGPLAVVHVGPDGESALDAPPQVAFAVGKRVGNAVERNSVRRRLREASRELARQDGVPRGASLVIVRPEVREMSYVAAKETLARAFSQVEARGQR